MKAHISQSFRIQDASMAGVETKSLLQKSANVEGLEPFLEEIIVLRFLIKVINIPQLNRRKINRLI